MRPTDEELMAYADDALDADARVRVAAAVAADPALAARVEAFAQTGRSLGTLFDAKLADPVPSALLDLLQPPPVNDSIVVPLRRTRTLWMPFALAASLALGVALGVTWSQPDISPTGLAALPSSTQLSNMLEQTASGQPVEVRQGKARIEFLATLSYREPSGRWCREFRSTALDAGTRTLGIACRTGQGQWTTEIALSDAYAGIVQDEGYFAVSGESPLQGGVPASPEAEAALIARGWTD